MTIQVSAYRWVPPQAQGWVRDLRIRWALEEAGLPYEVAPITLADRTSPENLAWQPFGQVPAYRDETVEMFESAAVVLHLADRSQALAPTDARGRARVTSWVIAAINSIEPFAQNYLQFVLDAEPPPAAGPAITAQLESRLARLSDWLGETAWLEDRFTAGDLVMACVLRELVPCGLLARYPGLDAYVGRCTARPAFGRALEAQLAVFRDNDPERKAAS